MDSLDMFSKEPEKEYLPRYFIVKRMHANRKLRLWISAILRGVGVVDKKWNFQFPLIVSSLPTDVLGGSSRRNVLQTPKNICKGG